MRMTKVGIALAMLLVASSASAQRGGGSGKGSPGRSAPSSAGTASPSGSSVSPGAERSNLAVTDPDTVAQEAEKRKWWEIGGGFETHRLIRQEDVANGENKVFNVFAATISVDPTEYDHIKLRGFLTQRFLADQNETGWRSEDLILSYGHYFPLKYEMTFKANAWVTAPTSLASQKASIITQPRIYFSLEKEFGPYFRVEPRAYGDATIAKYAENEGGAANSKYGLGIGLSAELTMPFHTPLSIGVDGSTAYHWAYNPNNGDASLSGSYQGAVNDPNYINQPITQTYLFEVYGRYILPTLMGFKSDITLALANGDPSMGSVGLMHDTGVARLYGGYRNNAEVYASFGVRY